MPFFTTACFLLSSFLSLSRNSVTKRGIPAVMAPELSTERRTRR